MIRRLRKGDKKGARSDFAMMASTTWASIIAVAIMGYFYNPDQIDKMVEEGDYGGAAWNLLTQQLFAIIPGIRDIGASLIGGYPARPSPIAQPFIDAYKAGKDVLYDDKGKPSAILNTVRFIGALTGLPIQFGKSAQYLWNVHTGQEDDENFNDWWKGLIYGKTKP